MPVAIRRYAAAIVACVACLVILGERAGADTTLIPLPEVIVDPNEGTTVGFLPVMLIANDAKSIRSIIAPDVRYNDTFGVYPTVRFFDYPDPKQKYFIMGGKGSKRGEDFEGNYAGQDLFAGWLDLRADAAHADDPFERFYGFGNRTPNSNEANWTSRTNGGSFFTGLNFFGDLQAFWQPRLRQVRVGRGGIDTLPQVRDPSSGFSGVKGINGASIFGQQFGLIYDDRDVHDIPTQGVFAQSSIEIVDKDLGSSSSFIKYAFEGKSFIPLRPDKKFIVALHAVLNYLQHGEDAPFYEKNSVGGISSLRAFGSHRFTDNHRVFLQAELRTNVYEREVFGVRAHLEIAPFLDVGRVFHSDSEFPLEDLHVVGGLGFRAVVVPQVVAYVDFGSSGGAPAAFTGIDYPF